MPKYAFIAETYAPKIGGVEVHLQNLHRTLKSMGYEGDVIILGEEPDNIEDDAIWIGRKKLFGVSYLGGQWRTSIKIAQALKRGKYDLWHFHDYVVYKYFMMAPKKFLDVPSMYMTFHGWEGKCPLDEQVIAWRQEIAKDMTGSVAAGAFIPKWYDTPVDIVTYGGVDAERFSGIGAEVDAQPLSIAYPGGLRKDTGIIQMVESLATLKTSHGISIPLNIYGEGQVKSVIEETVTRHDLDVSFHSPVKDILPVYRQSPIVFASGYLSILEALCSGRIVFSYYNNYLREEYLRLHAASDSLYICGSAEEMADQLKLCTSDLKAAIDKSRPGWEWAREQTWEKLARQHLSLWGWNT